MYSHITCPLQSGLKRWKRLCSIEFIEASIIRKCLLICKRRAAGLHQNNLGVPVVIGDPVLLWGCKERATQTELYSAINTGRITDKSTRTRSYREEKKRGSKRSEMRIKRKRTVNYREWKNWRQLHPLLFTMIRLV